MRSNGTSAVGSNIVLSAGTILGDAVRIGNHVSFHGDVRVGDGTRIFDGAVLGRPPLSTGNVTREFSADPGPLDIGARSVIGANTVLYGGSSIGQGVLSQSVRAAGSTTAR